MNNKVYLLSLTISGIKSIRNELRLDFYKKTVNKSFDPSKHRVKAIYGENGCGKTALVTAAQILKDLICDRECLENAKYQEFLSDVINLQDQRLRLECEFYCYTEPADQVYHYIVELAKSDADGYRIVSEELFYRKADYPASKVNIAYSNHNSNTAGDASVGDISCHITALKELGISLRTNIDTGIDECGSDEQLLSPEELTVLTKFIRLFKPELKVISKDAPDTVSGSLSNLIMDYGDYQISLQLESTGIRNLIRLWPCLKAAEGSGIVFIDDFDRNLNEIYFDRLIKYFARYAKGQLCCTVTNTYTMQELRKYKNSIDFLSSYGRVIHWRTSGNFSPDSLYRGGMIENLPFNIEPEDFLGML